MSFSSIVETADVFKMYRERWREYVKEIKEVARELFGEKFVKLCVFGSTIREDSGPLSDIDIAVLLVEEVDEWIRVRFRTEVAKRIGVRHPFEIHVLSEMEWDRWYARFVKDDFIEL